jgi:hypothetical protein
MKRSKSSRICRQPSSTTVQTESSTDKSTDAEESGTSLSESVDIEPIKIRCGRSNVLALRQRPSSRSRSRAARRTLRLITGISAEEPDEIDLNKSLSCIDQANQVCVQPESSHTTNSSRTYRVNNKSVATPVSPKVSAAAKEALKDVYTPFPPFSPRKLQKMKRAASQRQLGTFPPLPLTVPIENNAKKKSNTISNELSGLVDESIACSREKRAQELRARSTHSIKAVKATNPSLLQYLKSIHDNDDGRHHDAVTVSGNSMLCGSMSPRTAPLAEIIQEFDSIMALGKYDKMRESTSLCSKPNVHTVKNTSHSMKTEKNVVKSNSGDEDDDESRVITIPIHPHELLRKSM